MKQVVQRVADVLHPGLSGRQDRPVEQLLLIRVVLVFEHHHRLAVVAGLGESGIARVRQAGEDPGEFLDILVVVGLNRDAVVFDNRAVELQLGNSDREQLLHLTGIVLIRKAVLRRVRQTVVHVAEPDTHDWRHRDVLHGVPVIAERVVQQHVVVDPQSQPAPDPLIVGRVAVEVVSGVADHEDLNQRPRHPLPQLVLRPDGVVPQGVIPVTTDIDARLRGRKPIVGNHRLGQRPVMCHG